MEYEEAELQMTLEEEQVLLPLGPQVVRGRVLGHCFRQRKEPQEH